MSQVSQLGDVPLSLPVDGRAWRYIPVLSTGNVAHPDRIELPRDGRRLIVAAFFTGSGNIYAEFFPGQLEAWRPLYVRCHFTGGTGVADLALSVRSKIGSAYDTKVFSVLNRGTGADCHWRLTRDELDWPSPYVFNPNDGLLIQWTDPGTTTYGLEVGVAIGS